MANDLRLLRFQIFQTKSAWRVDKEFYLTSKATVADFNRWFLIRLAARKQFWLC